MNSQQQERTGKHLRRGSIGVFGVVFFVLATVSPMGGAVSGLPLGIGLGVGAGTPGLFVIVAVIMLMFVISYVAISRHIVSAGGFYVYIGEALGVRAGRAAGYLAFFCYNAFQIALWGVFGYFTESIIANVFGIDIPWIVITLAGIIVVGILGYFSVNVSASILGVSMILEILAIVVMDISILVAGGESGLTAEPFAPHQVFSGNFGVGFMFCFLLFIGIEATVIYSEEARRPRRTIPIAGIVAVVVIGAFYVLTSYALVVGYGVADVAEIALNDPANFTYNAASTFLGSGLVGVMYVLFIISVFADNLGFHNAINRYVYSLARDGWMPPQLGRTHRVHDSPYAASFLQTIIAALVVIAFWAAGLHPYTQMFLWLLSLGGLGLMMMLAATAIGSIVFFRRHRFEHSIWVTMIAPGIASAGLVVEVFLLVTNWDVQVGSTDGIVAYLPLLLVIPVALGVFWPMTRRPAKWKVEESAW